MASHLVLIIILLPLYTWSQQPGPSIQRSSIAVHLVAFHFPQQDSVLHRLNAAHPLTLGLALSFLKGITPRLDFHATVATSLPEFGKHALGEFDASIRAKLLQGSPRLTPFLQAG